MSNTSVESTTEKFIPYLQVLQHTLSETLAIGGLMVNTYSLMIWRCAARQPIANVLWDYGFLPRRLVQDTNELCPWFYQFGLVSSNNLFRPTAQDMFLLESQEEHNSIYRGLHDTAVLLFCPSVRLHITLSMWVYTNSQSIYQIYLFIFHRSDKQKNIEV